MKKREIKVLIADDHALIREGLRRIISFEDDIRIVGEADNGEKALELLKIYKPQVMLLDMNMPLMDGLEVLKRVKREKTSIKVIMLTIENDTKTIKDAINIGADGYILKESAGTEIVRAIKAVYEGEKYIDKSLVSILFSDIMSDDKKKKSILDCLTKRETEVLFYMSKGLNNKKIGKKLYLSEKTIKNYATNLFKKINADDRVQAAITAIENNIEEYYNAKLNRE